MHRIIYLSAFAIDTNCVTFTKINAKKGYT